MISRTAALLLLVGCANPDYPPSVPLDAELAECSEPEDCMIISLGCCDACNGGFEVAARVDQEDEIRRRYEERPCTNRACTLVACLPTEAVCESGTCAIEQATKF